MPASSFDFFIQDARNNFDAVRPAPIPTDANVFMGQCQNNIHISTNCYYGYHDPKITRNLNVSTDCEMLEVTDTNVTLAPKTTIAKKRSADNADFPQSKRVRQEVQKEKIDPETNETMRLETTKEDLELETLYWNIHGGNVFHLVQCL